MNKRLLGISFLLTGLLMAQSSAPSPAWGVKEGQIAFTQKLMPLLEEGNLFFSPYSISSALSLAYTGARGETAEEIRQALQMPRHEAAGFAILRGALERFARESDQPLSIANGLCVVKGEVLPEYRDQITKYYDAEIFPGDLKRINQWVSTKTRNRIPKILESLPGDTSAVILNAIYFKGTWETAFDKNDTRKATFTLGSGEESSVHLMTREGPMAYLETEELQMVSLPYKGGQFLMEILLPKEKGALAKLEASLDAKKLKSLIQDLSEVRERPVRLFLPRFTLNSSYELKNPMQKLGMQQAFMPGGADFSGIMNSPERFYLGSIIHKAFVQVDEEGTEAAAATAVIGRLSITVNEPPPPIFRADHPFLFMIREKTTGVPLFVGRFAQPEPAE